MVFFFPSFQFVAWLWFSKTGCHVDEASLEPLILLLLLPKYWNYKYEF